MLPSLNDIQNAIETGSVLAPDKISALDHDAILDARDSKTFSDVWMQSYNTVNDAWSHFHLAADVESQLEDIRRESFMVVSNATDQHEIASYVSDDFEIIAKAAATETLDAFILSLWSAYTQHTVPYPDNP